MNPTRSSFSVHKAFGVTLHPVGTSAKRVSTMFIILFALLRIIIRYVDILVKCRHRNNLLIAFHIQEDRSYYN